VINDFASLSSAVANWLARADLAAVIPDLIQLAEIRIFDTDPDEPLRVRYMHTTVTGTASSGAIPLPDDYLEMLSLTVNGGGRGSTLDPETSDALANADIGVPRRYVIVGNQIRIVGQDQDPAYRLIYYARPPSLQTAGQNWLILKAPNVYLYATLLEAAPYLKNDARIAVWGEGFKQATRGLKIADDRARFGPGLRMKPAVPNAP